MMERLLFKRHKRDNLVIIGMNAVSIRLLFEENCKKVLSSATFG